MLTEKRRKYSLNIKGCKTGGLLRGIGPEVGYVDFSQHTHSKNPEFLFVK
jgi:hypothetical protein